MDLPPLPDGRSGKGDRFWPRVKVGVRDECWPWTGPLHSGYGQVVFHRTPMCAHAMAFLLAYGRIEVGWHVHHTCENKSCCNPLHLEMLDPATHNLRHNPPQLCPHGTLGIGRCQACDTERQRRTRAAMAPEQRDEYRRRDRERKRRVRDAR